MFEVTPEGLRSLVAAPLANGARIAKAREALNQAADGWESAELAIINEIEATTYAAGAD